MNIFYALLLLAISIFINTFTAPFFYKIKYFYKKFHQN
ncbi:hypothetical protein BSPA14S_I0034 (plasmid) [Borreliella spielmanii A14S]|uniref:Uncharacterized protein n=1 Tax=Borreliella spielmanii A14S TaxID=498742 RepID=C0RCB3_9SPIR|nr:hypothetical protein BSPA14S_I0034 [Borreliella spielmanii A14S]